MSSDSSHQSTTIPHWVRQELKSIIRNFFESDASQEVYLPYSVRKFIANMKKSDVPEICSIQQKFSQPLLKHELTSLHELNILHEFMTEANLVPMLLESPATEYNNCLTSWPFIIFDLADLRADQRGWQLRNDIEQFLSRLLESINIKKYMFSYNWSPKTKNDHSILITVPDDDLDFVVQTLSSISNTVCDGSISPLDFISIKDESSSQTIPTNLKEESYPTDNN